MHKTERHAHKILDDFENLGIAIRHTTEDVKGHINQLLSDSLENVKDKSSDMKKGVEHYTAEKPFKSLGIALATGLIAGLLLRLRRNSRK